MKQPVRRPLPACAGQPYPAEPYQAYRDRLREEAERLAAWRARPWWVDPPSPPSARADDPASPPPSPVAAEAPAAPR